MSLHANVDNLSIEELAAPVRNTATANKTSVDLKDYVGTVKVILQSSAGGGTTPTLDVTIEDSADNSTFAAVSAGVFAQLTDAADATVEIDLDVDTMDRYVRAVFTISGTSPTFDAACVLVGRKQAV